MGCKDKGDAGGNGGISISANELKSNLKAFDADISMKVTQKYSLLGYSTNQLTLEHIYVTFDRKAK